MKRDMIIDVYADETAQRLITQFPFIDLGMQTHTGVQPSDLQTFRSTFQQMMVEQGFATEAEVGKLHFVARE